MVIDSKAYVLKRNGKQEKVFLDKITSRIDKLCYGLNSDFVSPHQVMLKVVRGLYNGITTVELDNMAAEIAASMTTQHPDYLTLAARIAISNLHKETKKQFSDVIHDLYTMINEKTNQRTPRISDTHYHIIMKNADILNSCIIYDRDYSYGYFPFKMLEHSYLLRINGKIAERPQHMLMRVAIGIHGEDIDGAIETYNYLSEKYFTHSSSTLFTAATLKPQMSAGYSIMMPDDSIDGIFKCNTQCTMITRHCSGIGLNVHNIRAKGTEIAGTNGISNGLAPMLQVFNSLAGYVYQGGKKRPAAITVYLEPWHADIQDFLQLKKSTGKEELRARDLSYALWIPDLFMRRVEENKTWSLMCPHECPGLSDCWGEEFEKLYEKYEEKGKFVRQIPARDLWYTMIVSQVETGMPHLLYKDACNLKTNQQNLGTIKCGSQSTEVIAYTSPDEMVACSLASIAVNMFVNVSEKKFDFDKLKKVTKILARNLNKIIDANYYPLPEAENSSKRHRPIGIGIQGLADAFILMRMPFESEEAALLNKQIFETLYFGALEASCELAEVDGPYSSYEGSPVSRGILQYDMWNVTPTDLWDWATLKNKISKYGVRNSLLIAAMPTSWTSQILGNNESFEPYTSYVYSRRVQSGELQVVNQHLLRDLTERDLWNENVKKQIIANHGSIQNIPTIPEDLKKIYKTVWEISNKVIFNMAADRGAFIDQSQSLSLYVEKPSYGLLNTIQFYGWKKGLKTGLHYLRTRGATKSAQSNVEKEKGKVTKEADMKNGDVKEESEGTEN